MAREREINRAVRYTSYGSVACQPEYEDAAVSTSVRREAQPHVRPRIRPREKVAVRPVVEVRQQGAVSLFAIVGFLAVLSCMFLLLQTGIQLAVAADETFDLQKELAELQSEEKKLLAQYEQAYDLSAIEREMTATGTMTRAGSLNTVYLDLSAADSVTYFEGNSSGVPAALDQLEDFLRELFTRGA